MELSFFVPSDRYDSHGRPAPLPGRNEMENASRAIRYGGASMKRHYTELVAWHALAAMRQAGWEAPQGKVSIRFVWREVNSKRDQDNIRAFEKYLLDGLKKAGAILDDSQRHIDGCTRSVIEVDKDHPGVAVFISTKED